MIMSLYSQVVAMVFLVFFYYHYSLLSFICVRGVFLDSPLCLNAGGRYFVDIVFHKQTTSDGSHILIDSVRKSSYE